MTFRKPFCLIFFTILTLPLIAQDTTTPLLEGHYKISVTEGTIDANVILKEIPDISDYYIFINAGLNIHSFRDLQDTLDYGINRSYDDDISFESFLYYLPAQEQGQKFLPDAIRFRYSGKFPVHDNPDLKNRSGDWKGNIAFNGKTLRLDGLQSGWYPVLFDIKNNRRIHEVRYDLTVECMDCKSMFLNGNPPVKAQMARFTSEKPFQIAAFFGDYEFVKAGDNYILNPDVTGEELEPFVEFVGEIQGYFADKLGIAYKDEITFIHTNAVSQRNSFLFASYPTIVNISDDEQGYGSINHPKFGGNFKAYIAHEMAHYYFGTYKELTSDIRALINESFAEYLAAKAAQDIIGEETYKGRLNRYVNAVMTFSADFVPPAESTGESDYGSRNSYLYGYMPLVWLIFDYELGEEVMWSWMQKMLTDDETMTDYNYLMRTLSEVTDDEEKLDQLKKTYLESPEAMKNAGRYIIDMFSKKNEEAQ